MTDFPVMRKRFSRTQSEETSKTRSDHESHRHKKHLPLIASPLDPNATQWLTNKKKQGNLTLKRRPTIAQFEADHFTKSSEVARSIFRKQHEASTVELFFDLFFVANLAVFTVNNPQVDSGTLTSYIGFFAILWSTWFNHSMFDVRFYVDSVFSRFCKMVSMGVMTGLVGLGPVFDTINHGGGSRAFHGMALVLMLSRLLIVIQHGVVLWFVRDFKKTVVPLSLTMAVYFASAMGFMATYVTNIGQSLAAAEGEKFVLIWYIIILVEVIAIIVISSIWRILSFKHTHVVERVGLLTLIVMGEGIIGLTKSVATVLKGTNVTIWGEIGMVTSAVLLIYLLFVLYFGSIEHDRFGTIRQQIWVILHFPLHVAILLTVEGSTSLLIWNSAQNGREWVQAKLPSLSTPSQGISTTTDWINAVNATLTDTATRFRYLKMKDYYDPKSDLAKVKALNATFGSPAWNDQVRPILFDMFNKTSVFIFDNFKSEMPKAAVYETDAGKKLGLIFDGYKVIYTYFYVAAGAVLLLLATMYWFSKTHKSKDELASVLIRVVGGLGIPMATIPAFTDHSENGFRFVNSGWIIPVVTLGYFVVSIVDNVINAHDDKRTERMASQHGEGEEGTVYHGATKSPGFNEEEEGVSLVQFAAKPGLGSHTTYQKLDDQEVVEMTPGMSQQHFGAPQTMSNYGQTDEQRYQRQASLLHSPPLQDGGNPVPIVTPPPFTESEAYQGVQYQDHNRPQPQPQHPQPPRY